MTPRALSPLIIGILLMACGPGTTLRPSANDQPRVASYATPLNAPSPLRTAIAPAARAHPGQSGIRLVTRGKDALRLRIEVIEAARHSVDLQYYLIEDDDSDQPLLRSLLSAADRGVRVRLLIDSLNFDKKDPTWELLNDHKNIQLRVFNPFTTHDQSIMEKMANTVIGLEHYNRRMHNKIIIADNQVGITGGRNLGNSYFGASADFNFHDVDIITVGAVIPQLSKSFDSYWNNEESFPLAQLLPPKCDAEKVEKLRAKLAEPPKQIQENEQEQQQSDIPLTPLPGQLRSNSLKLIWAKAEVVADSPDKLDTAPKESTSKPAERLKILGDGATSELVMISPYFVPRDEGVEWIEALIAKGVNVRILTNSLASTDALAPHSGYSRYREELLNANAELYEMKPVGKAPRSHRYKSNAPGSLHSKVYMIDRKDVLIGSFNFDPRSIELNTEQLIVIHSPVIAAQITKLFERAIAPERSFTVLKDKDSGLVWKTQEDGKDVTYTHEPEASLWRKTKSLFISLLPVEDQL